LARAGARARREKRRQQQQQERFQAKNVAQFFLENKQLAGFENPTRALYQTVRELVENALDATDAHHILPTIYVGIREEPGGSEVNGGNKRYTITVEDNGIGVPRSELPGAFGRLLYSSKYTIRQQRGMLGLGVKAAVLYAQNTTGLPAEIYSAMSSTETVYMRKVMINVGKNEPIVMEAGDWERRGRWRGTRVSITLQGNWSKARKRVIEYIFRTAVIAPYAEILLETPEGEVYYFPRTTKKMPKPPRETKPHPHGIMVEDLKRMLERTKARTLLEMLVTEFQSVGETTALDFLKTVGLDPNMDPKKLLELEKKEPGVLTKLVEAMKTYRFKPPRSDYLSPIGAEMIKLGLKRIFNPEWVDAITRKPKVFEGHPFIVEVGIAYGGNIEKREQPLVLRYANKIPLLYEETQDVMYKVVTERINWKMYKIEKEAPLVVLIHIVSTRVPFKGANKESIIDHPEIESEIKAAVQEVARRLKKYLIFKEKQEEAARKTVTLAKYIPEIARSLAVLSKPPEKWSPPSDEDIKMFEEALIKLVAKSIGKEKIVIDGREVDPEEYVKEIVESVKLE